MFTKFLALFAFVAAANAGIVLPETRIEPFPLTRTIISGPSGEIKQEEHLPAVSYEPFVEAPLPVLPPYAPAYPSQFVLPADHEASFYRLAKPFLENPTLRLVKHEEPLVRFVKPIDHNLIIKSLPHNYPYPYPTPFRSIYGGNYLY